MGSLLGKKIGLNLGLELINPQIILGDLRVSLLHLQSNLRILSNFMLDLCPNGLLFSDLNLKLSNLLVESLIRLKILSLL